MDKTNLRRLAKDYSDDVLSKSAYRKARREFIVSIIDETALLPENDYLPPEDIHNTQEGDQQISDIDDAITAFVDRENAQPQEKKAFSSDTAESIQAAPTKKVSGLISWFFIVAGASLIIAIIAISPELSKRFTGQEKPSHVLLEQQQNKRQSSKIIDDFLAKNSWHKKELDAFLAAWQQVTQAQPDIDLNSIEIKRLGNAIYQRLLEERSLAVTGDSAVLQRQQQLIDFAVAIGISDNYLNTTLINH